MTFWLPQLPPRAARTLASACGVPPAAGIFNIFPFAKKATKVPSGDQKGKLAFCVPGSKVTLEEPIRCTYSIGNPVLDSGETNASIEPSRESAMWLTFISCGTGIANCIRTDATGRRDAHPVIPATAANTTAPAAQ